ncbi:MAG TPA: hypothetical protein VMU89_18290 [Thermomicrobiaceae bacterium]|nr:hypothetical protein [Thermomicrobiaceae bacterium]
MSHTGDPAADLRQALAGSRRHEGVDLAPGCAFGAVTRRAVEDLAAELHEIKARLNYLFALMFGAVAVDVLLRLSGHG